MSEVLSISGGGSDEVNGDYIPTSIFMDGVPTFFMSQTGVDGIRREYSVCRSVSTKTKTKKWWICRNDRNGIDKDIDFYTCENSSDSPPSGPWTSLKGELPIPQLQIGGREVLVVTEAGTEEVNGQYTRLTATMDGVPKFSMVRVDGMVREYNVCRSVSSKTKTKKWWLCRTDRNGIDGDIDFYTCENESDTPPLSGWTRLKGEFPLPFIQYGSMRGAFSSYANHRPAAALVVLDNPTAIKAAVSRLNMSPSGLSALASLVVAADSPGNVQIMLDASILNPLLKMFAADVTNEKILLLLYNIACHTEGVKLVEQGLLPALHRCCEEWPEELKKPAVNAISIISKLSVSEKTERPMVDAGLHVCLLWAAEQEDTRESAFNALLNIAFAKDCKQALLDVGAIQVALRYGRDDTNSSAFKFLRSMSLHPPAFPKLAEVGMVALLKRNLAKNYKDEQNIWFVSNLSDLPEACVQICETGCLPYLKMAMDDTSPAEDTLRFRSWAITSVWRIAKVERCRPALLNARLQDSLVAHTKRTMEPLLAMMGLALLVGRAEEGQNSQLIQACAGLTKRLLESLQSALAEYTSGRSAFVKTKCSVTDYLNALACVATSDAHKAELTSREAISLLLSCCTQCARELDTVRVACDILLELTFSPAALRLLQDGPVLTQLKQLKANVQDPIGGQKVDALLFRVLPQQPRKKSVSVPKPFIPAVEGALPPPYAAAAANFNSPEEKRALTVYLSYHFEHQATAYKLREDLKKRGFGVWIDVEQGSGPDERAEGIEAASFVLMDLSSQYKESANCRLEAQYASQLKKKIIPIVFEADYRPTGWLGMVVANLRSHKCWHDSQYPDLLNFLTLELGAGKSPSSPSAPPPYVASAPPYSPPPVSPPVFEPVPPPTPTAVVQQTEWSCGACTYLNPMSIRACELCQSPRSEQSSQPAPKRSGRPSAPPPPALPPQASAPPASFIPPPLASVPPPSAPPMPVVEQKVEAVEQKVSESEQKANEQVSLNRLLEQAESMIKAQLDGVHGQLGQALREVRALQNSHAGQIKDLDALRLAISKDPQALPTLVQATIATPEYEEMLSNTERRLQASFRSHSSGLQAQLSTVSLHLSNVQAKTDAMYTVYTQQKSVLLEQEALLQSVIAPFYNSLNAVLSSRLQAVLLVASGVLQGKKGPIVQAHGVAAEGANLLAHQAVSLAAEVSVLAADAIPLVGAVVGALLRKGAERIDDYRSKKKQQRVAAQAVTTADAEALGELAARRCAQLFKALVEGEKARLDEEGVEKAGRKAGQTMYDALVGGGFDKLLDEAEKKDSSLKDRDLTAQALCLAVQQKAMTGVGVLRREGGIFAFKITQADVEKLIRENNAGLSPAEKVRRAQADDLLRAQASQLELLRRQMEVAVLSPRRPVAPAPVPEVPPEEPRPSVIAVKSPKSKDGPKEEVAIDAWLQAQGFPDLVPVLQEAFENVQKLILAFQGLNPRDIREELGLKGIPGLAVATKLREALDKEAMDS